MTNGVAAKFENASCGPPRPDQKYSVPGSFQRSRRQWRGS
jgi:hypothetical protein